MSSKLAARPFVIATIAIELTTVIYNNTTQNSSDNLPYYLQTNTIAEMLSIVREGTEKNYSYTD